MEKLPRWEKMFTRKRAWSDNEYDAVARAVPQQILDVPEIVRR